MVIRISRLVLRLLTLLLAIAAVTAGFFAWRLASGPVSTAWLTPYIERELSGDRVTVELEDTQLRLGRDQLLELTATRVQVRDRNGRLLSKLPEVEIGLSTSALLLERELAVRRIEAAAPSLMLTRREDGSIGFADDRTAAGATDFDIGLVLADFLMPAARAQRWGHIEEIRIAGGELVLHDRKVGRTLRARDAELRMARLADRVSARLAFTIAQAAGPAAVEIRAIHEQDADRIDVEVAFDDVLPAEFADFAPELPLSGVRLPLGGKARGAIGLDGELSPTRFDLSAQPGTIAVPELELGVLQVDALEVQGALAADLRALIIDRLTFSAEGALLAGRGEVAWRDGGPTLRADLEAENVTLRDLERYWPPRKGREAREWVTENLTAGRVPKVRASLRLGPGELGREPLPEHTLDGEFIFEDVTVRYLDTMPPVVGAAGKATFSGQRMSFDLAEGHLDDLVIEQGSIVITGIGIKGRDTTQLEIATRVSGPVAQALALIDRPPLEYASKVGIVPEAAGGRVTADLRIGMPLHRDLEPSEVRVAAEATITDGRLAGTPLDLSDGQLTLTVDRQGVDVVGHAIIEEVPLEVNLRENFDGAPFERRYRVTGVPELAALRRLGLELPIAAEGSVGVDATFTETAGAHRVELALDLAPTAIEAPWIGWRKEAGEPGTLDASALIPAEGPIQVSDFLLTSDRLRAEGHLEAQTAPFRLERLWLDRVRLGESEGAVRARSGGAAGYEIEIDARTLDLTPLLGEAIGDGADAPTPLRLGLGADRLVLHGGTLDQVSAELVRDTEGWRTARVTGRLPNGGEVRLDLTPAGDQRRLRVTSTDAGDLLHTLHQTSRIKGGELNLEAMISRQRPSLAAEGKLEVSDFRVLDAPILARLLTLASPTGIGDVLGGEGLWLDRLEAPFTLRDQELQLGKGRMYGSQLGLTFRGRVDLEAEVVDLHGTVVPLYGVNWTIGQIPIIGQFLRGEEGEGAFAATYTIRGPFDQPSVGVNPLAALAPGFLRELFTGLSEGTLEPPEMLPSHDD